MTWKTFLAKLQAMYLTSCPEFIWGLCPNDLSGLDLARGQDRNNSSCASALQTMAQNCRSLDCGRLFLVRSNVPHGFNSMAEPPLSVWLIMSLCEHPGKFSLSQPRQYYVQPPRAS